ncbi:transcriptional regulator, rpir family protein [Alsobacter metallidurans]|uniref:Transcriptional regulator, rpir family protein n=1 Tax=Alsobacter metallidurans TaxID=340221 RepID=A0A917I9E1_9HYPH|nr:MurR/RpiR family transcriptional regulator [Alsobacter metallidurans]GGH29384.1 transcriptional regulator, rpir family protein [Alsobacter metallidurans]
MSGRPEALDLAQADQNAPDILRAIRLGLGGMSEGQQRIGRMILDDPHWAVQTNVEDLATRAGVSAPTIVRFARAVGCDGLKDFKLKLAGALALGTPFLHRGVAAGDSTGDVVRNVVGSLTSVLAEWQRRLDPAEVERAAAAIDAARRVDCYGTGATSNFLAQDLQARLFRLGLVTNAFSDAHFQLVGAATMEPGDVLFAISFVGRMPALLEAVQLGRSRGATVIALTRTHTPLADLADIVLSTDVPRDATMRVGTEAYVVQLLIIEIVMVMVGLKRGPAVNARLKTIHEVLQTHGVDNDDPSLMHWGSRPLGDDE